MDVISEIINKGVPISTPISVRCNDLLEMSDNPDLLEYKINKEYTKYRRFLNSFFKMENIDIFLTMCVSIDPNTLEKKLIFSKDGLISSIMYNLNYDNVCNDSNVESSVYNFDINELTPRIERLRQIKDEVKLRKEFPVLFKNYKKLQELRRMIETIKRRAGLKVITPNIEPTIIKVLKDNGIDMDSELFERVCNLSVESYCKNVIISIETLIKHIDEINDYLDTHPFTLDDESIDREKLELYIATRFLRELEENPTVSKQDYVYFIAGYFRENGSRKDATEPEIVVDSIIRPELGENNKLKEGVIVTPRDLYEKFKEFLVNNPTVKPINFGDVDFSGMTLEEVEKFISDYLETYKAEWEIIPKSKYEEESIHILNKKKPNVVDYDRLKELFMEKIMFYTELDPFMIVKGKDTFDGYIGYIFSNGLVILDRFYENADKGKVSRGDAIYYMKIEDFYRLSHYSKRELMKMKEVGRIVHKGNWMEIIKKLISQSGDGMKTSSEAIQLINKKQIKKDS